MRARSAAETDIFPFVSRVGLRMGMIVFAGSRWDTLNQQKNGTLRWAGWAGWLGWLGSAACGFFPNTPIARMSDFCPRSVRISTYFPHKPDLKSLGCP